MPLTIDSALVVRKIDDEVFIYDRERAHVHTFNGTGSFLWGCLEKSGDETTLVDALCSEFDVDAETAQTDVAAFLAVLAERGLLEQ